MEYTANDATCACDRAGEFPSLNVRKSSDQYECFLKQLEPLLAALPADLAAQAEGEFGAGPERGAKPPPDAGRAG